MHFEIGFTANFILLEYVDMITRIKMNILFFMFLVIFGISLSGAKNQSKAQETVIIGGARTQTIEVNMESLTQFVQPRQPIALSLIHISEPTRPY